MAIIVLVICVLCLPANAAECPDDLRFSQLCLYLKWRFQFQSVGYYVAKERGFYDDVGLDVRLIEPGAGGEASLAEEVTSATGRYGVGTSGLLMERFVHQHPIVVIAALFQQSPLVVLALDRPEIRRLGDLEGRRVMLEAGVEELEAFFRKQDVDSDNFQRTGDVFDVQRLIDREVDAMSAYTTDELKILEDRDLGYRVFSPRAAAINFYTDLIFTSEQELRRRPDRVNRFLQASLRGWRWAFEHASEAIDLIETIQERRGTDRPIKSREQLMFEADQMRTLIGSLDRLGRMDRARWEHIAGTYADVGMLPSLPDVDAFFPPTIRNPRAWEGLVVWSWLGGIGAFLLLATAFWIARTARSLRRRLRRGPSADDERRWLFMQTAGNRRVIASHIITVLFGLAVTVMAGVLTVSIVSEGLKFGSVALSAIFFLAALRFLIGNQIHIASEEMIAEDKAFAWMYDLIIIAFQFTLMIFLANLASMPSNQGREYGFFEILMMIYAIDIGWILSQFAPLSGNRREKVPWPWAVVNGALMIYMIIINTIWPDIYGTTPLAWLLVGNLVAFFADVVLCDYARLYRFAGDEVGEPPQELPSPSPEHRIPK